MNRILLGLALAAPLVVVAACNSTTVCTEEPVCEAGEIEVESCEGRADCREVETCGIAIGCEAGSTCLAEPTCAPGFRQVDECPADVTCETVAMCGTSILCAPDACDASDDCLDTEFCDFPDDLCGRGEAGRCVPRPNVCSDGPLTCMCDGTVTDLGCAGLQGSDVDAGGACTLETDQFACGATVCSAVGNYCEIVTDDTGGPPYTSCGSLPLDCSECACLTVETQACNGTCVDGDFPTITCPGG